MNLEYRELAYGALATVRIAATVLLLGGLVGIFLGLWSARVQNIRLVVRSFAITLSVVPFLAVLFWFHYPLQGLLGVVWSPEVVTVVLLSAYVSIQAAEVFASELDRAKRSLSDASLVLGLTQATFLWQIVAPSAAEASLPRFLSISITTVHMTMFASLIGVEELFRAAQRVDAETLHPVEVYGVMAMFYAAICLPLYLSASFWNRRLRRGVADA